MIKNILVLTPIYPAPDIPSGYTPVVHYFTREWVKMGYNVRVINFDINFPPFFYVLMRPFNSYIASFIGCVVKTQSVHDLQFEMDQVKIKRIALTKYVPHGLCSDKEIRVAFKKSNEYLEHDLFTPDIIVSHWANPCLELMRLLKQKYSIPTCYISHGVGSIDVYGDKKLNLLKSVDCVGFRSSYIRKTFESVYGTNIPTFECYSGIPEKYIDRSIKKSFSEIRNFIFVGTLIKRKFPTAIIPALINVFGSDTFKMNYVGEGKEKQAISRLAKKYSVLDKIYCHGKLQRDGVVRLLDACEVFIMISKDEAFGLVYLEAMARGCITIASRKEGFDGIIQDGVNGFLCEAGNENELAAILTRIRMMSREELLQISNNAIKTASELTDVNAARLYVNNLELLCKKTNPIEVM